MLGHSYAVNKLAWLPHLLNMLLTAIYDMTGHVWNDQLEVPVNYGVDLLRMIQSV
jgi:peroxin-7